MEMFPILFLHFIFLCLFNGYLSSNPDSVIVESPEDNEERSTKIPIEEREPEAFVSLNGPRILVVRIMRPVRIGSRIVWREISREKVDRTKLSPFQTVLDIYGIRQTNPRRTPEKSATNGNRRRFPVDDRHPTRPNRVKAHGIKNPANTKTATSSPYTTEIDEVPFEEEKRENVVTKSPQKISPDSNFFAGIVNDFTFKMMETSNSNFVVSPLSVFIALSMCYLGADGNTKTQMEQAMGMDDNAIHGEHLHKGIEDLLWLVRDDVRGYKLFVANGMFLAKNFTPEADFVEDIKKYYDADIKNLDFGDPSSSLRFIKEWVANKTENMITSIFDVPPDPLTRLILYNAIYFKGNWKTSFPLHFTHRGKFYTLDGNDNEVELMNIYNGTFPIFRSDEYKHTFLKLPYDGDELSMIIALPYTDRQRPMPSITDQILCHVLDAMKDTNLDTVSIPKFRMDYKKSLVGPLLKLGISDIFNENAVNLKKLRKENDVHVSTVLHKAVIDVNEEGTTASAVTSVSFVALSARNSTNFVADHPFAFYIVHEPTGLVLFYGKKFDFADGVRSYGPVPDVTSEE